jgi:hypothetical protein
MSFDWKNRESHWAELRTRLGALRPIFPSGPRGETCRALFDDFLGLALDVLCDFLLDPNVPPPSGTEFNEIALLHSLLGAQNDCLLKLRDKRQHFLPD